MEVTDKTFHDKKAFERNAFKERMQEFGFKNMGRLELFLWDLELFLQIQHILGERIVLKGGAAVQFYLPPEAQRTSVDIDMLFFGNEPEIRNTLDSISALFQAENGLFQFVKYNPTNPKTSLPLNTYYVDVPSVLTREERRADKDDIPKQELKIEFITRTQKTEFAVRTGENIFAVNSKFSYQLLPINMLFADKLTTLGSQTIGVQNLRMDEQVKQFYDIMMLTRYCFDEMDPHVLSEKYLERAVEEWQDRKGNKEDFCIQTIIEDVNKQLDRYTMADSGDDAELKKYINDFHSLYLNSKIDFSPQSVACGASLVRLMYNQIVENQGWDAVRKALTIEEKLKLSTFTGREKGEMVKAIRIRLVSAFGKDSAISPDILMHKNLTRVFWSIVNADNVNDIEACLDEMLAGY